MGLFLSVSAVQDRTVDGAAPAIIAYAASNGVNATLTDETYDEDTDLSVAYENGWTVVLWPNHFVGYTESSGRVLSQSLQTLVSNVDIYDGDHWYHYLARDGKLLDQYSSNPGYFTADHGEKEHLRQLYRGDAKIIAA